MRRKLSDRRGRRASLAVDAGRVRLVVADGVVERVGEGGEGREGRWGREQLVEREVCSSESRGAFRGASRATSLLFFGLGTFFFFEISFFFFTRLGGLQFPVLVSVQRCLRYSDGKRQCDVRDQA